MFVYKNYLQNTNSETNSNLSIIYKKYKHILTSVLRKSESLHYSNDLMYKSNDFKATWNIINNLLSTNKTNYNYYNYYNYYN